MPELLRNNHFNQIRRLFSIQPYTTFDHNSNETQKDFTCNLEKYEEVELDEAI